jgi:hypothetical protein
MKFITMITQNFAQEPFDQLGTQSLCGFNERNRTN